MDRRALGPMLITAPSEHERVYEMAVRITRAEAASTFDRRPWIRITANALTGEVELAAGVKVKRKQESDDGA
jgi:hypothetical protein